MESTQRISDNQYEISSIPFGCLLRECGRYAVSNEFQQLYGWLMDALRTSTQARWSRFVVEQDRRSVVRNFLHWGRPVGFYGPRYLTVQSGDSGATLSGC